MFKKKIKIISIPPKSENPYLDLFYNALALYDMERINSLEYDVSLISKFSAEFDAVHFHWPEYYWRSFNTKAVNTLNNNIPKF